MKRLVTLIAVSGWLGSAIAAPTTELVERARVQTAATVEHVVATPQAVTGEIVSHSNTRLEDLRVQVTYAWHWNAERQPGDDGPGWAEFHDLSEVLKPGATVPFAFTPQHAPPSRQDGHIVTSVQVVGFTEYRE